MKINDLISCSENVVQSRGISCFEEVVQFRDISCLNNPKKALKLGKNIMETFSEFKSGKYFLSKPFSLTFVTDIEQKSVSTFLDYDRTVDLTGVISLLVRTEEPSCLRGTTGL